MADRQRKPSPSRPLGHAGLSPEIRRKPFDETILGNPRNDPETEPAYLYRQQRGDEDARRLT